MQNWKRFGLYNAKDTRIHHYEMSVEAVKQLDSLLPSDDSKRYGKEQISKQEWQRYKMELKNLAEIKDQKYKLHYLHPSNEMLLADYH